MAWKLRNINLKDDKVCTYCPVYLPGRRQCRVTGAEIKPDFNISPIPLTPVFVRPENCPLELDEDVPAVASKRRKK